jgi:MFS family permease
MRRRIFNVLFISVFATMLGLGIIAPLMPIYAESLGATGIWLGIIFAGFSLSRGLFMPIIGRISDKKGRKIFILAGLLIYTILSLAYIRADSVYMLTVIRMIHGFASAMVIPVAMAYIGEISPEGREGTYMGTFSVSLFLGMGLGPLIGGILKDTFGLASAFYAMSALSAISFLVCLLFLPELKTRRAHRSSLKAVIKNDICKALMVFRGVNALGMASIMAFLPIFASKIGLTSSQIGTIITTNVLLTALFQRPFGMIADRRNKLAMIVTGTAISAVSLFLIPFAKNFAELLVVASIMGLGGAISMPAASAMVVAAGRELGLGSVMGVFNMAMSAGMITAPLISGVIMDAFGLGEVFYTAGIISVVGILIFYLMVKDIAVGNARGILRRSP